MNKEQFKKWIMSMLYYRYKIKATENGEFLGMINDNLNQLINSIRTEVKEECAEKFAYVQKLSVKYCKKILNIQSHKE